MIRFSSLRVRAFELVEHVSQVFGESVLSLAIRRLIPLIVGEVRLFEKATTEKKSKLSRGGIEGLGFSKV